MLGRFERNRHYTLDNPDILSATLRPLPLAASFVSSFGPSSRDRRGSNTRKGRRWRAVNCARASAASVTLVVRWCRQKHTGLDRWACAVAHEPRGVGEFARVVDRGHPIVRRQGRELLATARENDVFVNDERMHASLRERCEGPCRYLASCWRPSQRAEVRVCALLPSPFWCSAVRPGFRITELM